MAGNKILVVEDDSSLLGVLDYNLRKESYQVLTAADGAEAIDIARREKPELIVLDIMLPTMSGFEVCRILRKETSVPILMLTARTEETDKVVGLEIGADDYVTKPFSMRELIARIGAMLRRASLQDEEEPSQPSTVVKLNNLEIDTARQVVTLDSAAVRLTPKEFDLLVFLARNHDIVFSREQLLEKVWGYDYAGDTRTVDVHIRWLRQKIEEDASNPAHLLTVRSAGYKLVNVGT